MKKLFRYMGFLPAALGAMYTIISYNSEQWDPGLWMLEMKVVFWIASAAIFISIITIKNTEI